MTANIGSATASSAPPIGSEPATCRVVVFGHVEDPTEFKQILTERAGLHSDDAMAAARKVPGILPMRLSRAEARAVVDQANQSGFRAISLPEAAVPRLDRAETIHHVRCQPEGLELLEIHGRSKRLIPWSDLSLLSAGCVPCEDGQRFSAEPQVVVHAAPNPHRAAIEAGRREGLVLWIACERPRNVYRLIHNQLNYEYLGTSKTASATQNFRLFVNDLAQRARQVYLTPATRAFLRHDLQRHFEFHSVDELRDDTAFHILVLRNCLGSADADTKSRAYEAPSTANPLTAKVTGNDDHESH